MGTASSSRPTATWELLHGAFALLRHLQLRRPLDGLNLVSAPKIQRRLLNHWDNLDRTVERGYSGESIWEWFYLPQIRSARYRDYARACASLGINGAVVTNVNANAQILTPFYLERVAALADELRPYGVRRLPLGAIQRADGDRGPEDGRSPGRGCGAVVAPQD